MSGEPIRIVAVSAGVNTPSSTRLLTDRLTAAVESQLRGGGRHVEITTIELREYAHDLADATLLGFPNVRLEAVTREVVAADGLIAVTPVFSASYSGLFKSFFDVIDKGALAGKPVLLAATAGSARHALVLEHAMRPLFSYLGTITVPTGVFAAAEDWAGTPAGGPLLDERVARAASQFGDLVRRESKGVPDSGLDGPFGGTPAFESLLRRN